ncbi:MAG: hypothetical protein GY867_06390 [bacterium]|nr:hypothetical protein [bacterium]
MWKSTPFYSLLLALVLICLAGCGGLSTASRSTLDQFDYEVARFDPDFNMTAAQLYDRVFHTRYEPEGGIVFEAAIKDVLDSVLVDTICGLEAREYNLRENWLQHFVYTGQVTDYLSTTFSERIVRPQIAWDSAEVIQYYKDHEEDFYVDEQVNLYHLFCSPRGWDVGPDSLKMKLYSRQQLWDLAEEYARNVYLVLGFGEPFQNAAFVLSHDMQSRKKGGFVGWTKKGIYKNPFDSVAFSLEPYEYSKPYKDEHGWHIVYSEGYVAEGTAPIDTPSVFASARQGLTGAKYDRRLNEIMDSLRALLEIEVNPAALVDDIYDLDDSLWAGVVRGMDTVWTRELKMYEEGFRMRHQVTSTTADIRREMLRTVAGKYLMVQAARSHGLDTLPQAREYLTRIWHSKSKLIVQSRPYDTEWDATDSLIEQYYSDHIEEYQLPKPLKVEHLKVKDSALADFLAEQVRAGVDLPELKREYGDVQGYSVEYRKPGRIGPEDVEEQYYLVAGRGQPMVGANVARTPSGFYVIRTLENHRPVLLPAARGDVRTRLLREHRRAEYEHFRDSLFQDHNVTFPGKLKAAEVPMLKDGRLAP